MMAIAAKNEKGFSMLEMLVCMRILSAFSVVTLTNTNKLNLEHYEFLNDYCLKQSEAMKDNESKEVSKGVYFNGMGHVNQARTIDFFNHKVIIHLGNGYATYQ